MNTFTISRENTRFFNDISNKLVYRQEELKTFINRPFSLINFKDQLGEKACFFNYEKRNVLSKILEEQYSNLSETSPTFRNIQLLKKQNTFTITTGHQLNLFTGPFYVIIKILHIINLAEKLHSEYPEYHFVPVYWLASEDHDIEEINHTYLFGKKVEWDNFQGGPTGRYDLSNWKDFKNELHQFFQNQPDSEIHNIIETFDGENLGQATHNLIHFLFEKYGLVIINGDNSELKKGFSDIMKKEVLSSFVEGKVLKTNDLLLQSKIKPQAFARPINLFYLQKGLRNRLISTSNGEIEIPSIGVFSKSEIINQIESNPERFSPNVMMRPLYQETVLPNLAYVGGGGEIAYWLQLKEVFREAKIPFPLIQVRVSVQIFDDKIVQKWKNLGFNAKDLFKAESELKKLYLDRNEDNSMYFDEVFQKSNELAESLRNIVTTKENESLTSFVEAEIVKLLKQIESINGKFDKNRKQKHDVALKQIEDILKKVFPNDGLIERKENFFGLIKNQHPLESIDLLKNALNPLEKDLLCIQW
jgi:bacillithiol biosynthesis cysteine-adding enzyme BshC